MKRFIALMLVLLMCISLVGCKSATEYRDDACAKYITKSGFEVIEKICTYGDYRVFLAYDTRTNVEYIVSVGNGSNGFCPYYGKDGNVVIYGGK